MTRDEFKVACFKMGYCSPKQAEEYMGERTEFTDDDFIEVYRKVEGQKHRNTRTHLAGGGTTSKKYYLDGESEGNR